MAGTALWAGGTAQGIATASGAGSTTIRRGGGSMARGGSWAGEPEQSAAAPSGAGAGVAGRAGPGTWDGGAAHLCSGVAGRWAHQLDPPRCSTAARSRQWADNQRGPLGAATWYMGLEQRWTCALRRPGLARENAQLGGGGRWTSGSRWCSSARVPSGEAVAGLSGVGGGLRDASHRVAAPRIALVTKGTRWGTAGRGGRSGLGSRAMAATSRGVRSQCRRPSAARWASTAPRVPSKIE